ncbi:hypothetical protein L226DRAFT_565631 [Lentinus tigrinus ALCF2SS1-7]|uniref:uncharacterized protein n=1 Tax=Lentinus tigrinus ALCF2SS1-7 TaxID=1328758 RepID=UPI001165D33F|nr:hypothetical protein L226DRAFT_565631 [Lentinus tigrinus ALCF2SS1-7]
MSNLSSSSSITPTPSTFHNTPTATHPNSVYVHSGSGAPSNAGLPPPSPTRSRIPVTPAVLRSIFASSRTALEERSLSRVAFFRYDPADFTLRLFKQSTSLFLVKLERRSHMNWPSH